MYSECIRVGKKGGYGGERGGGSGRDGRIARTRLDSLMRPSIISTISVGHSLDGSE